MENFIYSVDATFPIFLVMVIGYILKQIGMLNDNFVTVANRFNFKVTLPFMLFRDISGVDIRAVFDIRYVLFCALVSTACLLDHLGRCEAVFEGSEHAGSFCAGVVPQQRGGDGTGVHPEHVRKFGDGTADDRERSAALQYFFRDCADV